MKEISYYRDKNYWYFRYGNLVLGPHNIDRVKTNIKELPNRIKRSNDLIYPERKMDFVKWMIKKLDTINGETLDDAFTIMEGMEEGLSSIEAQNLIKYNNEFHKQLVRQYVYLWYKNGHEYFMDTLPQDAKLSKRQIDEYEHIKMLNNLSKGMQRKLKA